MNVVIDCNIFISAVLSQNGTAVEVLRYALKEKFIPQFGQKLFKEYEDVLSREHIIKNSKLSKDEIDELLNALLSISKWNEIYYLWRPNLKDEGDNHIVELAVASNSKYIITNNKKDFLDKELNFEFEIVSAKEFLQKEFYNECNNI
mgnify:CR=1 FL=1